MAIRVRRGNFSDFDPTKMVAGEPAAVLTGQPNSSGGGGIYISFVNGQATRLAEYEDMSDTEASVAESAQEAADSATAAAASALQAATSASAASTSATNASNSASSAQTAATNAATSAQNAATSEANAATSESNAADSATSAETSAEQAHQNTANEFRTGRSYAVGDFCLHGGVLYKCKTAISYANSWDASKWSSIKIMNEFNSLRKDITGDYVEISSSSSASATIPIKTNSTYVFHNKGTGTISSITLQSSTMSSEIKTNLLPGERYEYTTSIADSYDTVVAVFASQSTLAVYAKNTMRGELEAEINAAGPTYSDPNNDGNIVISLG